MKWSSKTPLPVTRNRSIAKLLFLLLLASCSAEQTPDQQRYVFNIPANLNRPMPVSEHNPTTDAGVLLGEKLFYDPRLSANNLVSCATCHQPDKAFSDGLALSDRGVSHEPLLRHVPQLTNVAWYEGYFWDGGAKNLESLVFGPLTHPDEMGQDLREIVKELGDDPAYPRLFREAFGQDTIHTAFVARALAQYMRTFISADSRYDRYIRGEGETLTPFELEGMRLVKEKCAACHAFEPGEADFFTDFAYHNNGLDAQYPAGEEGLYKGRYRVSLDSADIGAYKTPTLRNLPQSAPYMHDGRMTTMKAVLDHYESGIKVSPYLDTLLITEDGRPGIPMTASEKEAILAFLHTLEDASAFRSSYP